MEIEITGLSKLSPKLICTHNSMTAQRFTRSSDLPIAPAEFLSALTMNHVNAELMPLARMTVPAGWREQPIVEWRARQQLFSSWILLAGILPIDRHALYFDSIEPASGFAEMSTSTVNRYWSHQRSVAPLAHGCRVTDTIEYDSRLPLLGRLLKPVYQLVFWHRHRQLGRRYRRPVG